MELGNRHRPQRESHFAPIGRSAHQRMINEIKGNLDARRIRNE
jgi:hypothetical protein